MNIFKDAFSAKNEQEETENRSITITLPENFPNYEDLLGEDLVNQKLNAFFISKLPEFSKEIEPVVETNRYFQEMRYEKPDDWHTLLGFTREDSGNTGRRISFGSNLILQKDKETGKSNLFLIPDFREREDTGMSHTISAEKRKLAYQIKAKGENPRRLTPEEFDKIVNNPENKKLSVIDGTSVMFKDNF